MNNFDQTPQIIKTISNLIAEVRNLEKERPRFVYPFVTEVYKEIMVEASHLLPNHSAKCQFLHGHSYKVGVTLRARLWEGRDTTEGMVIDFKKIKEALKELVDEPLDHAYVNEVLYETVMSKDFFEKKHMYLRTTAEQMSWWIFMRMYEAFEVGQNIHSFTETGHNNIEVVSVDVWETTTSKATARREHFNYKLFKNNLIATAFPEEQNSPVFETCDTCEETHTEDLPKKKKIKKPWKATESVSVCSRCMQETCVCETEVETNGKA